MLGQVKTDWRLTGECSWPFCPENRSESGRVSKGDKFSSSTLSSISVRAVSSVASLSSSILHLTWNKGSILWIPLLTDMKFEIPNHAMNSFIKALFTSPVGLSSKMDRIEGSKQPCKTSRASPLLMLGYSRQLPVKLPWRISACNIPLKKKKSIFISWRL